MRYEKEAALKVVDDMKSYEEKILRTTQILFDSARSLGWKDSKHLDFCKTLSSVIQDIKNGTYCIRDYGEHLSQKIQELE